MILIKLCVRILFVLMFIFVRCDSLTYRFYDVRLKFNMRMYGAFYLKWPASSISTSQGINHRLQFRNNMENSGPVKQNLNQQLVYCCLDDLYRVWQSYEVWSPSKRKEASRMSTHNHSRSHHRKLITVLPLKDFDLTVD